MNLILVRLIPSPYSGLCGTGSTLLIAIMSVVAIDNKANFTDKQLIEPSKKGQRMSNAKDISKTRSYCWCHASQMSSTNNNYISYMF